MIVKRARICLCLQLSVLSACSEISSHRMLNRLSKLPARELERMNSIERREENKTTRQRKRKTETEKTDKRYVYMDITRRKLERREQERQGQGAHTALTARQERNRKGQQKRNKKQQCTNNAKDSRGGMAKTQTCKRDGSVAA
jgi:hypothetical protein